MRMNARKMAILEQENSTLKQAMNDRNAVATHALARDSSVSRMSNFAISSDRALSPFVSPYVKLFPSFCFDISVMSTRV